MLVNRLQKISAYFGKEMKNPILENISSLLCVQCGASDWHIAADCVRCKSCAHCYPIIRNGKLVTVSNYFDEQKWEVVSDGFDLFKGNEKPIKVDRLGGPRIKDLRNNLGITGIAINLGSGQDRYENFINIDLGMYEPVHIVADLAKVPLVDSSVDLVVSNSVLEHIYNYKSVIDEVVRILRKDGYFYLCVPNACLRHHKYDYHRWTTPGLHKLFDERFEIIDSGACRGIAYALITYVEALLSYKIKNRRMLAISRWLWRWISRPLFWMKDEGNEEYQAMSQTIFVLGRKL
jgi:predicted SAM-dependent methyltransferase